MAWGGRHFYPLEFKNIQQNAASHNSYTPTVFTNFQNVASLTHKLNQLCRRSI